MCDAGLIIAGTGMALGAYGNKRQADTVNNAQTSKFRDDMARGNQEFISKMGEARQRFAAQQMDAMRSGQRREMDEEAFVEAIKPLAKIQDAGATDAVIGSRETALNDVINQSIEAGDQQVASGNNHGNVSTSFIQGSQAAQDNNVSETRQNAKHLANIHGVGDIQSRDAANIASSGFSSNLIKGQKARQAEIDKLLFDVDLNRAGIDHAIAPDPIRFYNTTNRSAQLYGLLGSAMQMYGAFTAGGTSTPKADVWSAPLVTT